MIEANIPPAVDKKCRAIVQVYYDGILSRAEAYNQIADLIRTFCPVDLEAFVVMYLDA